MIITLSSKWIVLTGCSVLLNQDLGHGISKICAFGNSYPGPACQNIKPAGPGSIKIRFVQYDPSIDVSPHNRVNCAFARLNGLKRIIQKPSREQLSVSVLRRETSSNEGLHRLLVVVLVWILSLNLWDTRDSILVPRWKLKQFKKVWKKKNDYGRPLGLHHTS
ncbi:hypothetical protein K435DRAFT_791959 [Dendrothele bispora CBS 962.96]|uniref:Uncharacterized protein n=1 Tax=Dendrothele bispora (strain CBS 962.96) TaxID=1314807 RepID=A0A4S8MKW6_DENBC|nr:hypothetical protein K435DRAFT_791959 [Dendrothele bispora CBS 962.96]